MDLLQRLSESLRLGKDSDHVNVVGHEAISDERHSVEVHVLAQQLKVPLDRRRNRVRSAVRFHVILAKSEDGRTIGVRLQDNL